MTNLPQPNDVPMAGTSPPALDTTPEASNPAWPPPQDPPGRASAPCVPCDASDFERERERQARVARQHLRAALDGKKKFDACMLVLLGFALAFWVQIVVTSLLRPASP